MKKIQGVTITDHVVNAALKSSRYVNRFSNRTGVKTEVAVLIPEGDPLQEYLEGRQHISVFAGHPTDLITRFSSFLKGKDYSYVVRLTADCPLLPPFLVTKCVNTAIQNNYDFLDTANPEFRCFFDGADVEVMSRRAFEWLEEYTEEAEEREHVCLALRKNAPEDFKLGAVFSYLDLSAFKLSVDTIKDFELVSNQYKSIQNKKRKWEDRYGKNTAHMF
jgi:spore coat polysaccharide biosynthesis protein SpsF